MNIFTSIFNALKDGATQMGEAPVDENDISAFEQALAKANDELNTAKQSEASILAALKQAEAKQKVVVVNIEQSKQAAIDASNDGNEEAALKAASQVVLLEQELSGITSNVNIYMKNANNLSHQVKKIQAEIEDMHNHLSQVKATEKVHKAQETIQNSLYRSGGGVSSAKESLERIKAQQAQIDAEHEVAEEVAAFMNSDDNGKVLDQKLAKAQSTEVNAAKEMLERLKSQQ